MIKIHPLRLIGLLSWTLPLIGMPSVGAAAEAVGTSPADLPRPTVTTSSPAYPNTAKLPDSLLDPRPRQVIVLPTEPRSANGDNGDAESGSSVSVVAKLTPESHRLPEGYIIANRRGHVEKQDKWYIALLNSEEGLPDAPPLRVLPNERLGMLEAILREAFAQQMPEFLFTGRITEFEGVNYILLENLVEILPSPHSNETANVENGREEPPAPAATVATRPMNVREPTAEEVVQQLMQSAPHAVRMPERRANVVPSGQAGPDGRVEDGPRWPEETLLIDQVGRVLLGESGYQFVFEDKGSAPAAKPIRLLPNRLLENAVATSGAGTKGIVFIVSGEITVYQGTNYLLLRKVLQRRDLGNIR